MPSCLPRMERHALPWLMDMVPLHAFGCRKSKCEFTPLRVWHPDSTCSISSKAGKTWTLHRHISFRSQPAFRVTLLVDRTGVTIAPKTLWSSTEKVRCPEGSLLTANCLCRCLHLSSAMLKHLRHGWTVLGTVRGSTYAS